MYTIFFISIRKFLMFLFPKGYIMQAHLRLFARFSFVLFVSVFMLNQLGKGTNTQPEDQNLKGIVDLNETLDEMTPTQFAAQTLKDFFHTHDVTRDLTQRPVTEESKNDIFQKSFLKFIKDVYNKRDYALALSQDPSHIIQFVDLSNEMNLETNTVYVGLRLFLNKIKEAELVDDTVITTLLESLPKALERHFTAQESQQATTDLSFIKKHIESTLLVKLTDHLNEFQTQPDSFISTLSEELATYCKQQIETVQKQSHRIETRERLRQVIIRLFDTMLAKTIWNPKTPENIWKSFCNIANNLQLLGNHSIINHMDDLDDLLWTHTYRFCFYLDLTGAAFPSSFYHKIEHNLENKSVFFLEFKEQDEGIISKKEILGEALLKVKARSIAYEKSGIIATTTIF